ncbi:MAG: hypothetical protein JWO65_1714, partial [Sphingomonas bacterium]|nr:hypothetical protein [Sphingomonas bacterium]
MTRGAYWAGTPLRSDDDVGETQPESIDYAGITDFGDPEPDDDAPAPGASLSEKIVLGVLALVALVWIAAMIALAMGQFSLGTLQPADIVRGVSVASGPLALIVALLILWQRNSAREAQRYSDVARAVRMETLALDAVLSLTSRRLAEDRQAVAEQADMLLQLADVTSTRMRSVTDALAREIAELSKQSRDLDAAAGTARVDMGVLLADLPIAEGQIGILSETIRTAGLGAHEQAAALEASLAALAGRAREAEDGAAGAANRLSAQVSRIAGASEMAARDIDDAGQRMNGAIDGVLQRAADAVERTHSGITAQGEAIDAMIERGHAATDSMSAQATTALETRVAAIGAAFEAIAAHLAEQDGTGAALIERIQRGLAGVEARFAELDESGRTRTER